MATNGAKRVRDKDGKQRALVEAAAEVFAEQGFEAAVTKEIARRAGCSESMLFHYFGDKQGIFEQVVSRQIAEGVTEAEDKVMEALPNQFVEFVEQLFETRLHQGHGTVPGWDIAGRALSDPSFSMRVVRPNHEHRVSVIAKGVAHYRDLGQITPNVDPVTLAELLANFTIFTTTVGPRWFGTTEPEIRAQIELGARIFAEGVRPSSPSKITKRPGPRRSRSRSGA
ncbi:AcrR family transcriptional regulator [Mycobacterium nebraskense]|uniref:AcrR family transcriptional regulator n=1 Tax=Mycobacterium nebraskense TaxID=244292 RepID=A0A1X1ZJI3_9MYCO|nr:TetR/AcrR family transcriptional regulator [Mycobacterium nebraskense]KKC05065.1 AcrR family transcriptional regulator [Mycobacterium nebraskense]MCV7117148.1 TetR/AcrR family transcriptional regulator [Mycobacterium nebraskense]ORW23534.1 AcrR family transcriptional regulator [Mycobacterium nebraskense]